MRRRGRVCEDVKGGGGGGGECGGYVRVLSTWGGWGGRVSV